MLHSQGCLHIPAPSCRHVNLAKGSYGGRALQGAGGFKDGLPLRIILLDRPDVVVGPGDPEYEVGSCCSRCCPCRCCLRSF